MVPKDKGKVSLREQKRLLATALGIFFLFSLLIYQFYKIQIADGKKWTEVARKQHFFAIKEPFSRGAFWSNTGLKKGHPEKPQKLVCDIQKFHLYIDPLSIPEGCRQEVADNLAAVLDLKESEREKFYPNFALKSRSRRLVMWLDREIRDEIHAWWKGYARANRIAQNAVYFLPDYQRSYPFGKLLGQVLHTVQSQKDEVTMQGIPTGGLELAFDPYLRGKEGKRLLKRSPRHAFETGQIIAPPENGADIYLTVNHYLQAIAEEEVERGVKRCHAKSGWAVMMDPHTGYILALAQYPFFYPSRYREYFNDPERIEHTRVKAITDANEPGSTIKPLTIAVALLANQELKARGEKPLFDPEEKLPCADGSFPGRSKPIQDVRKHNYLNMSMAMQKSSNIYFARLMQRVVERLGNSWYREKLERSFGLGLRTGIELPSESCGVLPTPGKLHPNGALEWSTPTPFSLAMGYNLQCNSIQLLRAWAVLANRGFLVQPTLVRKIVKKDEGNQEVVLLDREAEGAAGVKVLEREQVELLISAMKYVTKPGGSGRRGDIWGYTEAGKTGTAIKIVDGSYSRSRYVASFIGFAPVEKPRFVLLVVMDEPEVRYIPGVGNNHHGSISAAPVFKEIGRRALEYLGVSPDDPYGYPFGDPRYDGELADWLPETRKLQEMYEKWNN